MTHGSLLDKIIDVSAISRTIHSPMKVTVKEKDKLRHPQFFHKGQGEYKRQQQQGVPNLFGVHIPAFDLRDPAYTEVYDRLLTSYDLKRRDEPDAGTAWATRAYWLIVEDVSLAMSLPVKDLIFDIEWRDIQTTQEQLLLEVNKKYEAPEQCGFTELCRGCGTFWVEVKPELTCYDGDATLARLCEIAKQHGSVRLAAVPEWVHNLYQDNDKRHHILTDEVFVEDRYKVVYDPKRVKKLRQQQAASAKKKVDHPKISFDAVRWLNNALDHALTEDPAMKAIGGKFILNWKSGGKRLEQLCDRIVGIMKVHRAITGMQAPWSFDWNDKHLEKKSQWEQRHSVRLAMREVLKSVPLMLKHAHPTVKAVGRAVKEQLK